VVKRYNKRDVTECKGIVASNGRAHEQIVRAIASLPDLAHR
jgi:hypothetical protein